MSDPRLAWLHRLRVPSDWDDVQARLAGLLPPPHYQPPPWPSLGAQCRTAAVASWHAGRLLLAVLSGRAATLPVVSDGAELARIGVEARRILSQLGVSLELVDGTLPAQGGVVLMWNQCSHLDHLIIPALVERPFFSLFNTEVMRTPIYGPYLRRTGHLHLDRHDEASWRQAVDAAAKRVARGEMVLISPEGTRSWDGQLLPMKRGALILALSSRCPVVCLTLSGAERCLPRGCLAVRPGLVRAAFSSPLATTDRDLDQEALGRRVAQTFSAALARLQC